ncbi:uncharacterized protein EDB91DRAFT_1244028 [Suillus paluster]|uniref:uncharacterized protein n=1 Tax=Suillus paluster TaxID=48578 RepID=UPI001B85BF34|nr:uncharacterized protein EDB91DRAFT_1244028 [Suillus paluster]KAG1750443.1 hypothetical protein EDB91DRAFT_1244028 [Suillus paluster]
MSVMKMNQADEPKAELMSLAEKLHSYILSFLPWQDILHCTSAYRYTAHKDLLQPYTSSSDLQYTGELGGQHLLPVSSNNHTPISERLQLLRDKVQAWFRFDVHYFKTVSIPEQFLMQSLMGTSIS